jgi:hypothetical protein
MLEKIKKNRRKIERYAIATAAGIAAVVIVKQSNVIKEQEMVIGWVSKGIVENDKTVFDFVKATVAASNPLT